MAEPRALAVRARLGCDAVGVGRDGPLTFLALGSGRGGEELTMPVSVVWRIFFVVFFLGAMVVRVKNVENGPENARSSRVARRSR